MVVLRLVIPAELVLDSDRGAGIQPVGSPVWQAWDLPVRHLKNSSYENRENSRLNQLLG